MKKALVILILLFLCVCILTSCKGTGKALTVNGEKIDQAEYAFFLNYSRMSTGQDKYTAEELSVARQEAIDRIVINQVVRQKCKELGLKLSKDEIKQLEKERGITNKYRKSIILSSFALLCALLGIIGTFWVRAVARRQEIGIMQSMGATRTTIVRQFVTEATILATIAFVFAALLLIQYVYMNGFAEPIGFHGYGMKPIGETLAWRNKPVPHFLIVSMISYLLVTIISIIGTAIPVASTVKKEPVEALREE